MYDYCRREFWEGYQGISRGLDMQSSSLALHTATKEELLPFSSSLPALQSQIELGLKETPTISAFQPNPTASEGKVEDHMGTHEYFDCLAEPYISSWGGLATGVEGKKGKRGIGHSETEASLFNSPINLHQHLPEAKMQILTHKASARKSADESVAPGLDSGSDKEQLSLQVNAQLMGQHMSAGCDEIDKQREKNR